MNPTPAPRSMLFVSGEKPERFAKAVAAGADLVCIDLEDAVHPDRKAEARSAVLAWLKEQGSARVALRINGLRTLEGLRDVLALAESGLSLPWLLVPKVEAAADLQALPAWCGGRVERIAALIETPQAVEQIASIASAGAGAGVPLAALMLGGADLSAELGCEFGWDGLLHARGRLVNAARAAGLQAWDVPHIDLRDPEGLATETRRVIALGFDCKSAIHPQQLEAIHAAFMPSEADRAWAGALLNALPPDGATGAFVFQGRMVDAPVLAKARRIAARAAHSPHP